MLKERTSITIYPINPGEAITEDAFYQLLDEPNLLTFLEQQTPAFLVAFVQAVLALDEMGRTLLAAKFAEDRMMQQIDAQFDTAWKEVVRREVAQRS